VKIHLFGTKTLRIQKKSNSRLEVIGGGSLVALLAVVSMDMSLEFHWWFIPALFGKARHVA